MPSRRPLAFLTPESEGATFSFFPIMKTHLKGRHFGTVDNIQTVEADQLKRVPVEEFQNCFQGVGTSLRRTYTVTRKSIGTIVPLVLILKATSKLQHFKRQRNNSILIINKT